MGLFCTMWLEKHQNRRLGKSPGWLTTIWPFFQQRRRALQICSYPTVCVLKAICIRLADMSHPSGKKA